MHPLAPKGPMPRRTARVRSCGQLCDICVAPRGALCYRHDLFTANIDSGDGMPIQLPRDHPDSLIACMYMCSAPGLWTPHTLLQSWNLEHRSRQVVCVCIVQRQVNCSQGSKILLLRVRIAVYERHKIGFKLQLPTFLKRNWL